MARVVDKKEASYTVTIELNQEEAEVLRFISMQTGGPPSGPRGIVDRIGNALAEAGVLDPDLQVEPHARAIYFK